MNTRTYQTHDNLLPLLLMIKLFLLSLSKSCKQLQIEQTCNKQNEVHSQFTQKRIESALFVIQSASLIMISTQVSCIVMIFASDRRHPSPHIDPCQLIHLQCEAADCIWLHDRFLMVHRF